MGKVNEVLLHKVNFILDVSQYSSLDSWVKIRSIQLDFCQLGQRVQPSACLIFHSGWRSSSAPHFGYWTLVQLHPARCLTWWQLHQGRWQWVSLVNLCCRSCSALSYLREWWSCGVRRPEDKVGLKSFTGDLDVVPCFSNIVIRGHSLKKHRLLATTGDYCRLLVF